MEFIRSNRGTEKLIYNGYVYVFEQFGMEEKSIWKCDQYKKIKCKGRIHTKNDKILKEVLHNHEVFPKAVNFIENTAKQNVELSTRAVTNSTSTSAILYGLLTKNKSVPIETRHCQLSAMNLQPKDTSMINVSDVLPVDKNDNAFIDLNVQTEKFFDAMLKTGDGPSPFLPVFSPEHDDATTSTNLTVSMSHFDEDSQSCSDSASSRIVVTSPLTALTQSTAPIAVCSYEQLVQPFQSPKSMYQFLDLSYDEIQLVEEKGIQLPSHFPLTKWEEIEFKKTRRKLRNRISAHVSRKRKKEYVNKLEVSVERHKSENSILWRENIRLKIELKYLKRLRSEFENKNYNI